jgi:pimeloyl-ACP methyl ester carboxylesterase
VATYVRSLYLHGADDGALGVDIFGHPPDHLPAADSAFEIVDGTGHFLHLERPDLISVRILDWLG